MAAITIGWGQAIKGAVSALRKMIHTIGSGLQGEKREGLEVMEEEGAVSLTYAIPAGGIVIGGTPDAAMSTPTRAGGASFSAAQVKGIRAAAAEAAAAAALAAGGVPGTAAAAGGSDRHRPKLGQLIAMPVRKQPAASSDKARWLREGYTETRKSGAKVLAFDKSRQGGGHPAQRDRIISGAEQAVHTEGKKQRHAESRERAASQPRGSPAVQTARWETDA
ncbi:hypothetical protein ACFO9Q_10555 [Paenibacillus sp. GCM10023252]|uniref:hypothetical protein n=1 Tax=Paenibacillus sp. GCM10023252 TaxID=3252649 RepID=UPI0036172017